jgi:hypothetical protein
MVSKDRHIEGLGLFSGEGRHRVGIALLVPLGLTP